MIWADSFITYLALCKYEMLSSTLPILESRDGIIDLISIGVDQILSVHAFCCSEYGKRLSIFAAGKIVFPTVRYEGQKSLL